MSLVAYNEHINNIASFLKGDRTKLYNKLTKQMKTAVKKRQFEKAAALRDQLKQFAILAEKQSAILPNKTNVDVWANYAEANSVCMYLLKVRLGKITDTDSYILKIKNPELLDLEATQFLEHYYLDSQDLPKEVLLSFNPVDVSLLEKALLTKTNKKIKFITPIKGNKINLIKTAKENARQTLRKALINAIGVETTPKEILLELQKILNLPTLPLRIECYDNSNIQGSFPVGSMVVFKNGLPQKSEYRKFKFEGYTKPDDFAQMQEMLERRIKHLEINGEAKTWPKPDLIVIDGGKGQLGAVVKIFKKHKIDIPVIGLAKRIEEIFLPENSTPIILKHADAPLQLLQRLRDEAHRFAITFHKSRREKGATKSALDTIPGIGPKTKKLLKQKFGTVAQIRAASTEELAQIIGARLANRVKNVLG
jgi:excinuclease ABC subunit C